MSNDAHALRFADAGFGIDGAVRAASATMMMTMTITTRRRAVSG